MRCNTTIIYNVEKPKELVMLEKYWPYVYNWEWGFLLCSFFFSILFTGKTQLQKVQHPFFFFPLLKTPHKKTWILCAYKSKDKQLTRDQIWQEV